jgi:uncharacterized protein YdhG (YjbR/CyaY superfamily)
MRMKPYKTIDEYIASFPEGTKRLLTELRKTIQKAAPVAEEAISYGIPTYKFNGNLVHFGGYVHHIGFYPGSAAMKKFSKELKGYKQSKGTVQFPLDKPLPLKIVKEIVAYRLKENSMLGKKKR